MLAVRRDNRLHLSVDLSVKQDKFPIFSEISGQASQKFYSVRRPKTLMQSGDVTGPILLHLAICVLVLVLGQSSFYWIW
jgi:hypothetical protein